MKGGSTQIDGKRLWETSPCPYCLLGVPQRYRVEVPLRRRAEPEGHFITQRSCKVPPWRRKKSRSHPKSDHRYYYHHRHHLQISIEGCALFGLQDAFFPAPASTFCSWVTLMRTRFARLPSCESGFYVSFCRRSDAAVAVKSSEMANGIAFTVQFISWHLKIGVVWDRPQISIGFSGKWRYYLIYKWMIVFSAISVVGVV